MLQRTRWQGNFLQRVSKRSILNLEEKRRFYKILLWFTKVSDMGASLQNKDAAAHSQKREKEKAE